jgi:hypothetical protein
MMDTLGGTIKERKEAFAEDKINRRPISTNNLMRPPSRHKTPPKALGLDLIERAFTPPDIDDLE